jgi:hypothetical protein
MPGTHTFFQNLKRSVLQPPLLSTLRDNDTPSKKTVHELVDRSERFIRILAETAWSLEERPGQLILSLGVGPGQPIEVTLDWGKSDENKFQAELLAHAKKMTPDPDKGEEIDRIVTRFGKK